MRTWGRWVAEVRQLKSRNRIWLGSYDTPRRSRGPGPTTPPRGPSALLNFPATPPEIPPSDDLSPSQIQEAACRHAHRFPATAEAATVEVSERQEGSYNLAMAEVDDHDGLTCNMQYQSPRLWTF